MTTSLRKSMTDSNQTGAFAPAVMQLANTPDDRDEANGPKPV